MEYKNALYHHYRFRFDILSPIYLQHKCTTQKGIRYFYTKRSNYIKGGPSMIKSGKFITFSCPQKTVMHLNMHHGF